MATFYVRPSQNRQWFWRIRANNNESVAWSGETYVTRQGCNEAVALVKSIAASGNYERYVDVKGEYRWRLKARNGRTVAVSEGYVSSTSRDNSIAWMRANAPTARVDVAAA